MAVYDPVLCSLALHRSQEIVRSRYDGDDQLLFGYEFVTRQVFDVPPLPAKKRSKTDSGVIVDVPGREV